MTIQCQCWRVTCRECNPRDERNETIAKLIRELGTLAAVSDADAAEYAVANLARLLDINITLH